MIDSSSICRSCGSSDLLIPRSEMDLRHKPLNFPPRSIDDIKKVLYHKKFHQAMIGLVIFE